MLQNIHHTKTERRTDTDTNTDTQRQRHKQRKRQRKGQRQRHTRAETHAHRRMRPYTRPGRPDLEDPTWRLLTDKLEVANRLQEGCTYTLVSQLYLTRSFWRIRPLRAAVRSSANRTFPLPSSHTHTSHPGVPKSITSRIDDVRWFVPHLKHKPALE